jgi:hypothetical protein
MQWTLKYTITSTIICSSALSNLFKHTIKKGNLRSSTKQLRIPWCTTVTKITKLCFHRNHKHIFQSKSTIHHTSYAWITQTKIWNSKRSNSICNLTKDKPNSRKFLIKNPKSQHHKEPKEIKFTKQRTYYPKLSYKQYIIDLTAKIKCPSQLRYIETESWYSNIITSQHPIHNFVLRQKWKSHTYQIHKANLKHMSTKYQSSKLFGQTPIGSLK